MPQAKLEEFRRGSSVRITSKEAASARDPQSPHHV